MGRVHVKLSSEVEEKLRDRVRRKGDLSRIVEEALKLKFALETQPRNQRG